MMRAGGFLSDGEGGSARGDAARAPQDGGVPVGVANEALPARRSSNAAMLHGIDKFVGPGRGKPGPGPKSGGTRLEEFP